MAIPCGNKSKPNAVINLSFPSKSIVMTDRRAAKQANEINQSVSLCHVSIKLYI